MPQSPNPTASGLLRTLLASPWLRPLNDPVALDDLLALVDATWSLTAVKARVVAAVRETRDVRTLLLRPNRLWPGHTAGQHVPVEVEIYGRRLERTFSLSSPPRGDGLVAITVKRREGGRVSAWWNDEAAVGDVLTLGAPAGDFVLPAELPPKIVMLSAGSGITPVMALLRDQRTQNSPSRIVFVHSVRSREDVIFGDELEELACGWDRLDLQLHFTGTNGRIRERELSRLAAQQGHEDLAFVCGPGGFMDAVAQAWREAGIGDRLVAEHFGLPVPSSDGSAPQQVRAARSEVVFEAGGGRPLLVEAESAGLTPAYGCRIGICQTCKCRKVSGAVEDLRTGRVSDEPGEMIQLCISAARSPVTLDL